jgi:hypothetical protein
MSGPPVDDYDFFIAHAGGDTAEAEHLFDALKDQARVFLDSRCLRLGDQWDVILPEAQRRSRVTVVTLSRRTDAAFYQREEVAAAIDLARHASHRVVPVFLEGPPGEDSSVPYGLRRLHYAVLTDRFSVDDLARQLLELIRPSAEAPVTSPSKPHEVPSTPDDNRTRERQATVLSQLERSPVMDEYRDVLVSCLPADEELVAVCKVDLYTFVVGQPALLAVSDRRVIWVCTAESTTKVRDLSYEQIIGARVAERGVVSLFAHGTVKLVVDAWPDGVTFHNLHPERADAVARMINERATRS